MSKEAKETKDHESGKERSQTVSEGNDQSVAETGEMKKVEKTY